jgi:hypothetical protein
MYTLFIAGLGNTELPPVRHVKKVFLKTAKFYVNETGIANALEAEFNGPPIKRASVGVIVSDAVNGFGDEYVPKSLQFPIEQCESTALLNVAVAAEDLADKTLMSFLRLRCSANDEIN